MNDVGEGKGGSHEWQGDALLGQHINLLEQRKVLKGQRDVTLNLVIYDKVGNVMGLSQRH